MSDLVFYTNPQSRGGVVRWLLTELGMVDGQDYQTVILEYGSITPTTGMKSPEYLAINPMGKVPAIKDGETVITETSAICLYLADKYSYGNLSPEMSVERGTYYRWMDFAHAVLEPMVMAKSMNQLAPADKAVEAGYGTYEDVMKTLNQALATANANGGYLCGIRFTTADLYLSNALYFYTQFNLIEKTSAIEQFVNKHTNREAFVKAHAIDEALMAENT